MLAGVELTALCVCGCVQLGRQLQMQQQMRSRMIAQQLAMGREAFDWLSAFYAVAAAVLIPA